MTHDQPDWLRFSTDAIPERDRFPVFCEEIIRRQVALDAAKPGPVPFDGKIEACRAGAVDIARITTSPARYIRTRELVRDGRDSLFAVLCLDGAMQSTQGDSHPVIGPGEGLICDSTQIGGVHMQTTTRYWALQAPRADLARLVPNADRLAGSRLNNGGLALRLLSGYLQELHSARPQGGGRDTRIFGDHLLDLVALALVPADDALHRVERPGVRAGRRAALLREIEARFGDAGLNAAGLASRLGITPRYVHLLLEETGMTLSEHVLGRRLDRASAMLLDPRDDGLRIVDIAYQAGFTDLSHFNRSFRRRFGDTPSGMRSRPGTPGRG